MEYREFRAGGVDEDDSGKLIFRAAPFNSETIIGDLKRGGWREEIAPGCFAKALREGDTVLLADHDMAKPISRMSAGTLNLAEGDTHLEGDATPADTSYYRDLRVNIKAGNKRGMSIGFEPVKDEWFDDDGQASNRMVGTRRVLREVKLPEVSIVTNPAYKDTNVFARDASAALLEERAAKATYADLETCGECGATGQYGAFCSACGEPMNMSKPAGEYCTSCGAALEDSNRSEHQCEVRAAEGEAPEITTTGSDYTDMAAQLITAYNALPADEQAALPEDLRSAIEALASEERTQEPDASTPEDDDADNALRDAELLRSFRSRELGYV